METITLSREEVAVRGKALYQQQIRAKVETTENIGKWLLLTLKPATTR
jgi:hypothetical protein